MRRARHVLSLLLLCLAFPALAKPPRLTLLISVDSLGTDLLLRMRPRLKGGLAQLLDQGAFFPSARYEYAEAVTAAGHTTLATGANPWRHGIVSNRLINRTTGKSEAVFADPAHPVLEAPLAASEDASPATLMAETLSDRLRMATQGRGKSVAISTKARAAIPLAGRLGQAWWFSEPVGKFVTGTSYTKEFPVWVKAFNDRKLPDAAFGKQWTLLSPASQYVGEDDRPYESDLHGLGRVFPHPLGAKLDSPGPRFYSALTHTPAMVDLLVQLAKAALEGEQLGKDEVPDLLQVSFSPVDRVFHLFGPYSWEMQDMLLRLDRALSELIGAAERAAGGRANLVVALSADHGGGAIPQEWTAAGLPASRLDAGVLLNQLSAELKARFGANLVLGIEKTDVYLDGKAISERKLDETMVRRTAAQWLARQPQVLIAVAKDDLGDPLSSRGYARALMLGYFPERSGDVLFVPRPFVQFSLDEVGTDHGAPYAYDLQVPIVLAGKGIRRGFYPRQVSPVDLAPTLATLMEIGAPAMAEGAPLPEALAR